MALVVAVGAAVLWVIMQFGLLAWLPANSHPVRNVMEGLSWVAAVVAVAPLPVLLMQRILGIRKVARPPGDDSNPNSSITINNSVGVQIGDHNVQKVLISEQSRHDALVAKLREAILSHWRDDIAVQELREPGLELRWHRRQDAPIFGGSPAVAPDSGDVLGLAAVLGSLPRGRLVVLGDAGSGKTTSLELLLLAMLEARPRTDPVPVLFALSSWDIVRQSLREWMAKYLTEIYPVFDGALRGAEQAALALVEDRSILPLFDGLDELPPEMWSSAIQQINQSFTGPDPFVLSCRTDEFLTRRQVPLAADLAVELLPLNAENAFQFLITGADEELSEALNSMRARIDASPAHPMHDALSSPLTLWLLRRVIRQRRVSPYEILDRDRFSSAREIREYLIQNIPGVLLGRARRTTTNRRRRFRRSPRERKARRWLTFLAVSACNEHRLRIDWWHFHQFLSWRDRKAVVIWMTMIPSMVLWVVLLAYSWATNPDELLYDTFWTSLLFLPFATALALRARFRTATGANIMDAFAGATLPAAPDEAYSSPPDSVSLLRTHRKSISAERRRALLPTPSSFLLLVVVVAVDWDHRLFQTLFILGALYLTTRGNVGYPGGPKSPWPAYAFTRLWLARKGYLPIRLTRFLELCQMAGLLRSVGASFEFRHSELQLALARSATGSLAKRRTVIAPTLAVHADDLVEAGDLGRFFIAKPMIELSDPLQRRFLEGLALHHAGRFEEAMEKFTALWFESREAKGKLHADTVRLRFRAFVAMADKEGSLRKTVRELEGACAEHVSCFGPDNPETQTAVRLYRQAKLEDFDVPRHRWPGFLALPQRDWEVEVLARNIARAHQRQSNQ